MSQLGIYRHLKRIIAISMLHIFIHILYICHKFASTNRNHSQWLVSECGKKIVQWLVANRRKLDWSNYGECGVFFSFVLQASDIKKKPFGKLLILITMAFWFSFTMAYYSKVECPINTTICAMWLTVCRQQWTHTHTKRREADRNKKEANEKEYGQIK